MTQTSEPLNTHQKALQINLDEKRYGSFAEIGAGQEDAVLGLAARAGLCEIGREKDLAGICRCLVLGLADNPATGASG